MNLKTHGIVALIKNGEEKYLLLEEAREEMNGCWSAPHGRCSSRDKTEEDAVIREVFEETQLNITPIRKIHTQPADTKVETVSFWLVKTPSNSTNKVQLNDESSNYRWATIDEALKLKLYPGTKSFFEMCKNQPKLLK